MRKPILKSKIWLLFLSLILLSAGLSVSLFLVQQAIRLFPKAEGIPANIVVDPSIDQGPLNPIWQALAQGGEEKYPFDNIQSEIIKLKPKYIRIDHIYDFYNVVQKENGQLIFNWGELDKQVEAILRTGALPFFSLSYMPPAIARDGDITGTPLNWNDWTKVVQQTVQHYSGKEEGNLTNVIYEVWNEPDLFGNWRIGGEKDYRTLYRYAVLGANQAENTNPFKIGGPAITAPYRLWLDGFLDYVVKNKLRLDFYSWHRYSLDPGKFLEDIDKVDSWLFRSGGYSLEKYLTESSLSSENSPLHDSNFAAAHLVATTGQLLQRVDLAFTFEIKDGLDPSGKKYWGRWGLLTHEKAGLIEEKPKYFAFQLLNKINGHRINLKGEGSWVTGFATKDGKKIQIILTNLDPANKNFEMVPLAIVNLENGTYFYKESFLIGEEKSLSEDVTSEVLRREIPLEANNIVLIELIKI